MNHTGKHHLWLMLLCGLIPIVALGAIFLFSIPANTVLLVGIFLLCPILHLWMMKGMGGHSHDKETGPNKTAGLTDDQ